MNANQTVSALIGATGLVFSLPLIFRVALMRLAERRICEAADGLERRATKLGKSNHPQIQRVVSLFKAAPDIAPGIVLNFDGSMPSGRPRGDEDEVLLRFFEQHGWVLPYMVTATTSIEMFLLLRRPVDPRAILRIARLTNVLLRKLDPDGGTKLVPRANRMVYEWREAEAAAGDYAHGRNDSLVGAH